MRIEEHEPGGAALPSEPGGHASPPPQTPSPPRKKISVGVEGLDGVSPVHMDPGRRVLSAAIELKRKNPRLSKVDLEISQKES